MRLGARVLIDGRAEGLVLRLAAPISFWGGVEAASGRIVAPRHPDYGASLAGRVLALPGTVGSSSSSAILLELLRVGRAPAALVLAEVDAILALGVIVAREMGYRDIPVLHGPVADFASGLHARIEPGGRIDLERGA